MTKAIAVALMILAMVAVFHGLSKGIESKMKSHMSVIEELASGK